MAKKGECEFCKVIPPELKIKIDRMILIEDPNLGPTAFFEKRYLKILHEEGLSERAERGMGRTSFEGHYRHIKKEFEQGKYEVPYETKKGSKTVLQFRKRLLKPNDFIRKILGQKKINLSKIQEEFVEKAINIFDDNEYSTLVANWGKGSGKNLCGQIIVAMIIYELLEMYEKCRVNPQEYFNHFGKFDILNVAVNSEQAQRNFYKPFRKLIMDSPYFRKKLINPGRFSIEFQHDIFAYCGHSRQSGFEGLDLLVGVIDEADEFKTNVNKTAMYVYSIESMYDMILGSVESRFPGKGKCVLLSYPRLHSLFTHKKYEEGEADLTIFGSKAATWEANPTRKKEDFDNEYNRNFARAERIYECKITKGQEQFFEEVSINKLFNINRLHYEYGMFVDNNKVWAGTDFKIEEEYPVFIHVDLGKNVRGGIVAVQLLSYEEPEKARTYKLIFAHELLPEENTKRINIKKHQEIIEQLILIFPNIMTITYDKFQSEESIQYWNKKEGEIKSYRQPILTDLYKYAQTVIEQGRLFGYYYKPLVEDLQRCIEKKGRVWSKIKGGRIDMVDALVGALWAGSKYDIGETSEIKVDILGAGGNVFREAKRESEIAQRLEQIARMKRLQRFLEKGGKIENWDKKKGMPKVVVI